MGSNVRADGRVFLAWPVGDDNFRIIEMEMPELPVESEARMKTLKDTGEQRSSLSSSVMLT